MKHSHSEHAMTTGKSHTQWPKHSAAHNRKGTHPIESPPPHKAHRTHQEDAQRTAAMTDLCDHG